MRKAIGMLMYILRTRPELGFAVGALSTIAVPSQAMPTAPTTAHKCALWSVLKYLAGTRDKGLTFSRRAGLQLDAGCDASYGTEMSTNAIGAAGARAGGYIRLNGAAIDAWSKRCRYVTLSTTEAELYALVLLLRRLLCVRRLLSLIVGYSLPPTRIAEDNQAVVKQIQRRDLTSQSRHVRVNIGFIIDAIEAAEVYIEWVPSQDQIADALTAAEERVRFTRNRDELLGGP